MSTVALVLIVFVSVMVIMVVLFLLFWLKWKNKFCFASCKGPSGVILNKMQETVINSSDAPPQLPLQHSGIMPNTLQRQRSLSRKFSAKSRLSSAFTEQYFQADIIYDPEWEVRYDSLKFTSLLGEGAFGRVMKGTSDGLPGNRNPTVVAIKMLKGRQSLNRIYAMFLYDLINDRIDRLISVLIMLLIMKSIVLRMSIVESLIGFVIMLIDCLLD